MTIDKIITLTKSSVFLAKTPPSITLQNAKLYIYVGDMGIFISQDEAEELVHVLKHYAEHGNFDDFTLPNKRADQSE